MPAGLAAFAARRRAQRLPDRDRLVKRTAAGASGAGRRHHRTRVRARRRGDGRRNARALGLDRPIRRNSGSGRRPRSLRSGTVVNLRPSCRRASLANAPRTPPNWPPSRSDSRRSPGLPLGLHHRREAARRCAACVAPSRSPRACPPIVGVLGLMVLALSTQWLSVAPAHSHVPALALALPIAAMIERVSRKRLPTSLTASASRGCGRSRIAAVASPLDPRGRHASRPVLGLFGVILGSLFSGSLAVEWVSSWPGLGRSDVRRHRRT